jgi:hypothetical protein
MSNRIDLSANQPIGAGTASRVGSRGRIASAFFLVAAASALIAAVSPKKLWEKSSHAQRVTLLEEAARVCKLPKSALVLKSNGDFRFYPPPNAKHSHVVCAVRRIVAFGLAETGYAAKGPTS